MAKKDIDAGFSSLKYILEDIKWHLRMVSDFVDVSMKVKMEMTLDIRYTTTQIGYQDSMIDGHDWYLKELMGTVDVIKEEMLKLFKMNQCIHFQELLEDGACPMEEVSITHPAG